MVSFIIFSFITIAVLAVLFYFGLRSIASTIGGPTLPYERFFWTLGFIISAVILFVLHLFVFYGGSL